MIQAFCFCRSSIVDRLRLRLRLFLIASIHTYLMQHMNNKLFALSISFYCFHSIFADYGCRLLRVRISHFMHVAIRSGRVLRQREHEIKTLRTVSVKKKMRTRAKEFK